MMTGVQLCSFDIDFIQYIHKGVQVSSFSIPNLSSKYIDKRHNFGDDIMGYDGRMYQVA